MDKSQDDRFQWSFALLICKNCKNGVRTIDVWYLFPNAQFTNRALLIGRCSNCKKDVVQLVEQRKSDGKGFIQNEVGAKAQWLADLCLKQIDYTKEDSEQKKGAPAGFVFGKAKKDVKNKRYGIYRVDFNNQEELIGYLPFNSTKIQEE